MLRAKAGFGYTFPPIMAGPIPIAISIGGSVRGQGPVRDRVRHERSAQGARGRLRRATCSTASSSTTSRPTAQRSRPNRADRHRLRRGRRFDLDHLGRRPRRALIFTTSLDLDDSPNADGKLHIEEISQQALQPDCLFIVARTARRLAVGVRRDRPLLLHEAIHDRDRPDHAAQVRGEVRATGAEPGRRRVTGPGGG